MSATLDPAPIAQYLGDCPTVESLGGRFRSPSSTSKFSSNEPLDRLAADGVRTMLRANRRRPARLPAGRRRDSSHAGATGRRCRRPRLRRCCRSTATCRSTNSSACSSRRPRRKVVLATNVAETSLTIDGVTGVVDSGWARVNQLDPQLGLNRLELVPHLAGLGRATSRPRRTHRARRLPAALDRARASVAARFRVAGDSPRVDLSEAVLQLFAWGESDVRAFPWYEPPPAAALDRRSTLLDAARRRRRDGD